MKRNQVILTALALLLTVGLAFGQPHEPQEGMGGPHGMMGDHPGMMGKWGGMGGRGNPMMRGIELTDKQKTELSKMQLGFEKQMMETHSDMASLHTKLKLAAVSEKFSQSDVDEISGKLSKLMQKQIQSGIAHFRSVREMLTTEQQVQFDKNFLAMKPGEFMKMGQMGPMGHMGKMCGMEKMDKKGDSEEEEDSR